MSEVRPLIDGYVLKYDKEQIIYSGDTKMLRTIYKATKSKALMVRLMRELYDIPIAEWRMVYKFLEYLED